jgi:hypothetical protein
VATITAARGADRAKGKYKWRLPHDEAAAFFIEKMV